MDGVNISLNTAEESIGAVELYNTQLGLVIGANKIHLSFSAIKTIDLHQPIFGANYIVGEYNDDNGRPCSFTLTFKRGGATDFTRLFFRLAKGELQQNNDHPVTASSQDVNQEMATEDKKNK